MDREHVLGLLDTERAQLASPGLLIEVLPEVTRDRARDGSHHAVAYSALHAGNTDAVIDREVAHHRARGVPFEWKAYSHDAPADLVDRLARRGFEIGEREAVVACDLEHPPSWIDQRLCDVVRVDRPEQVDAFRRVAELVFGEDYSFTANELLAALAAGSTQHRGYVAHAGAEPIAVGRLYTQPGCVFGGLYGGGTLPAHRGRGAYRALVAARARDAIAAGARYLLVDALPTSRPILERLGFEQITETWPCTWKP